MKKLFLLSTVLLGFGCASRATISETPWFCSLHVMDADEIILKVRAHPADHSANMARAIMSKDDSDGCWGPAALFLGARLESKAYVLIDKRLIELTARTTEGRALTEVEPLLIGLALTAQFSSPTAERAVGRLKEMADPKWWKTQDPTEYESPRAKEEAARIRAQSVLYAFPYTKSKKALIALQELRDNREVSYRLGAGAEELFDTLIRETRATAQ